jgi:hypothetical protein
VSTCAPEVRRRQHTLAQQQPTTSLGCAPCTRRCRQQQSTHCRDASQPQACGQRRARRKGRTPCAQRRSEASGSCRRARWSLLSLQAAAESLEGTCATRWFTLQQREKAKSVRRVSGCMGGIHTRDVVLIGGQARITVAVLVMKIMMTLRMILVLIKMINRS